MGGLAVLRLISTSELNEEGILMRHITLVLLLLLNLFALSARASTSVPVPLQPWVDWVLAGEQQHLCPFLYNQSEAYRCAWPTQLTLNLTDKGGEFRQLWQLYQDTWVPLPGDQQYWPQQITVNGEPQPIAMDQGRPRLKLAAGRQLVTGQWQWAALPKNLMLPPTNALLALTINNTAIAQTEVDHQGRLWLAPRSQDERSTQPQGDALTVQVFRKIADQIPLQISSQITLEVAGEQRELLLGPVLLDTQIPLQLDSPLPASIEPDGRLRVQLRPGRWTLTLLSRSPGPVNQLTLPAAMAPWPAQEIWVFQAEPQLRLVEVDNLTSIDPQQTQLPPDWQRFPAYQLSQGDSMQLREIRRGNQEAEPNPLHLQRQLWLDFDGGGYSVQDTLGGQITQGGRLETTPDMQLGQVTLNGQPQLITRLADANRVGVEVRQGPLNLTADSRYLASRHVLPAVGWNTDLHTLRTLLHLPPGWSLLAASGMDQAPDTWLARWTLLDLFLVLLAAVAAYRLWGWPWGVLTLLTLVLIWHESAGMGPPRWVWLHLLAATALLRVLPAGRLRQAMIGYRNISLLLLLLIAIPFMVAEVRIAMYPQLAPTAPYNPSITMDQTDINTPRDDPQAISPPSLAQESLSRAPVASPPQSQTAALAPRDPNARLQTGPGLPSWQWRSTELSWNGPVQQDQQIRLVLLSPAVNLVLHLLRVLLLSLLILRMAGFNISRRQGIYQQYNLRSALLPITVLPLLVSMLLALPVPAQADIPDQELLAQLKTRLLAPPDCLPQCAQIATMQLTLTEQQVTAELEVHTQATVAVPLPGNHAHWRVNQVLINGQAAEALLRDDSGVLYLRLPAGIHHVQMQGTLLPSRQVQLELPLPPHKVQIEAYGWTVQGLDENGVPKAQLQFSRIVNHTAGDNSAAAQAESGQVEPGVQPGFVQLTRTLRLGLDWQVETQVQRLSPLGLPITLAIPLLKGESVLTEGRNVQDGKLQLTLDADQSVASWQSRLEKSAEIRLTAADTRSWVEHWLLDASTVWHVESDGLPVIQQQDNQGNRLPEWRPWPGESLTLHISRPAGVAGQTLTIDGSQLTVAPGHRAVDVSLALQLRSSQGTQHTLQLPDDISLQAVVIDGKHQAVRLQEDNSLTLPITPGTQNLQLNWRQQSGITPAFSTPDIGLHSPSVNNHITMTLGEDRWVLLAAGPRLGPAVLFWSVLAMVALLAFALSRVPFTPLRFQHWLLLGIGLTQVPLWMALVVVAWLLALGLRGRWQHESAGKLFNLAQVGLVLLTLLALSYLFLAIQQGLLGLPDMQISGHGSSANTLRWYQDRSDARLPQAWVFSVPLWVYRVLMLSWALWLAFALLRWLRWGWGCFSYRGLWRPFHLRLKVDGKNASKKKPATPDAE